MDAVKALNAFFFFFVFYAVALYLAASLAIMCWFLL